jgi:PPOX class probable F420-dependent enzyme
MITPDIAQRLDDERIIWMTTVKPDGQPQSAPVWFVRHDDEIRVWSLDGYRVANLEHNPKVSLHLNDNGRGGEVVIIEADATIEHDLGPSSQDRAYVERYQHFMDENGWTWGWFDANYPVPIRIQPTRIRAW